MTTKPVLPTILDNPVMKWAVLPNDVGSIKYIEGMTHVRVTVPFEGDVLTVPFLVDPATNQPVPVRVSEIRHVRHDGQDVIAVVVSRQG